MKGAFATFSKKYCFSGSGEPTKVSAGDKGRDGGPARGLRELRDRVDRHAEMGGGGVGQRESRARLKVLGISTYCADSTESRTPEYLNTDSRVLPEKERTESGTSLASLKGLGRKSNVAECSSLVGIGGKYPSLEFPPRSDRIHYLLVS